MKLLTEGFFMTTSSDSFLRVWDIETAAQLMESTGVEGWPSVCLEKMIDSEHVAVGTSSKVTVFSYCLDTKKIK